MKRFALLLFTLFVGLLSTGCGPTDAEKRAVQVAQAKDDALKLRQQLAQIKSSAEAEKMYRQLEEAGLEVLFDDRPARAGEKFSDADLIGIPTRLTISKRTLEQGKVEFKLRRQPKAELLSLAEAQARIRAGQAAS